MDNASHPSTRLDRELENHRVLVLLTSATRSSLAKALTPQHMAAGERLTAGERFGDHIYWLLEGRAELLDADGDKVLDLRAGDLFGLGLGNALGICGARATTAATCVRLDLLTVQTLCRETPGLTYFLGAISDTTRSGPGARVGGGGPSDPAITEPHPMHLHGTLFQVIGRTGGRGNILPHEKGLKDTVFTMPGEKVRIIVKFERIGKYVFHCHNLEHEEDGMMLNFEVK